VGDVLIAAAMRSIGDLDDIKAARGLSGAILAVLGSVRFVGGVFFMALSFFSLLFALSHADLSLVAPASASLTFVTNAVAAKIFLKENVDRRRWIAAVCVCAGVILMAH
jgi:drug/metabolite transporter (DMT)-like permease